MIADETADRIPIDELRVRATRMTTAIAALLGHAGGPELGNLLAVVERFTAPPVPLAMQPLERAYEAAVEALQPLPIVIEGASS